jgi:Bax protein
MTKARIFFGCATIVMALTAWSVGAQEVIVFGDRTEVVNWLKAENWWGEEQRGEQLRVPHALIAGISQRWQQDAKQMPVAEKKEIFYRFILPLIVHANTMVLERRVRLERMAKKLAAGKSLLVRDLDWLREVAVLLRIVDSDSAAALKSAEDIQPVIDDALYRLDVIPAGLALGQAAYESGYGTSRFAVSGNALFGQWTFGGEGLVPEQQRKSLGDHRIAAFEWPFDSIRAYFINLSSHPAYEDLRRLRAELKASGKPVSALALADGLTRYSERGPEYVETLKGIIRVNHLDIADDAVFRDEPMRFVLGADDAAAAAALREEIDQLRISGELARIIKRMRLE